MFSLANLLPPEQVEEVGPSPAMANWSEQTLLANDPVQIGILTMEDAKTLFQLYMDEMSTVNALLDPTVHTHGTSAQLPFRRDSKLISGLHRRLCSGQIEVPILCNIERYFEIPQRYNFRSRWHSEEAAVAGICILQESGVSASTGGSWKHRNQPRSHSRLDDLDIPQRSRRRESLSQSVQSKEHVSQTALQS
jgi:hypothetical protein